MVYDTSLESWNPPGAWVRIPQVSFLLSASFQSRSSSKIELKLLDLLLPIHALEIFHVFEIFVYLSGKVEITSISRQCSVLFEYGKHIVHYAAGLDLFESWQDLLDVFHNKVSMFVHGKVSSLNASEKSLLLLVNFRAGQPQKEIFKTIVELALLRGEVFGHCFILTFTGFFLAGVVGLFVVCLQTLPFLRFTEILIVAELKFAVL